MLTNEDMKKLEKKFVTREEFHSSMDELTKIIMDGFNRVLDRIDEYHIESQNNRIILGDHEKRIQRLERT